MCEYVYSVICNVVSIYFHCREMTMHNAKEFSLQGLNYHTLCAELQMEMLLTVRWKVTLIEAGKLHYVY